MTEEEGLMQELTLRASVATISDEDDIYKSLKVAYCMSTPEAAYQLYSSHIQLLFSLSALDTEEYWGAGSNRSKGEQAQDSAEAADVSGRHPQRHEPRCFTESEQRAAAHSLRKCKNQSPALLQWLAAHS